MSDFFEKLLTRAYARLRFKSLGFRPCGVKLYDYSNPRFYEFTTLQLPTLFPQSRSLFVFAPIFFHFPILYLCLYSYFRPFKAHLPPPQ